jgi:hypothetical protein
LPNLFFNNFENSGEQDLYQDLIQESIGIYGHYVAYCPRTLRNRDQLYGTDTVSIYNNAYYIDMYIKNIDGFTGDGRFLSKFNIEVRDEITFSVARREFENIVGAETGQPRPDEGDLIFMPMNNKIYIIKYVQQEAIFYPLGSLPLFDLVCESYEYSSEVFNTGIPEIDIIQKEYSTNMSDFALLSETGLQFNTEDGYDLVLEEYNIAVETIADNTFLKQKTANGIVDFNIENPFGESVLENK